MLTRGHLDRNGVRLSYLDFGGTGASVLLLHGLAGHAGEWAGTGGWLTERAHVVAPDARGHGQSERAPTDTSPAAGVADVAFLIEQLHLAPAVLVGQSLGGQTALLVAARHPELVRALVMADAGPRAASRREVADVERWLRGWPAPFRSREAAAQFFGGPSGAAEAWAGSLEQREGAWWPAFDPDVIVRILRDAAVEDLWQEWEAIECPTLVVRAGRGQISPLEAAAMVERLPHARLVELPGAEHDLHLHAPARWRRELSSFVDGLARC